MCGNDSDYKDCWNLFSAMEHVQKDMTSLGILTSAWFIVKKVQSFHERSQITYYFLESQNQNSKLKCKI